MNSQERQELIARYRDGYNQVADSLNGFPKDALTAHPIEGKWALALRSFIISPTVKPPAP